MGASTAYRARRADPAFAAAWDGALLAARPRAEEELACRALDGVEEQVFYRGEVIAVRTRYDSRLLLAHLARLDKLAGEAAAAAFADDFDAALARFARGEDQPPAERGRGDGISAPGQCATCAKSYTEAGAAMPEADAAAGEDADDLAPASSAPLANGADTGAPVPRVERLLSAMAALRPAGARLPGEFPGYAHGEVEAEQLAAFEAEVERWWLVVPPAPGSDQSEWTFAEDAVPGRHSPG